MLVYLWAIIIRAMGHFLCEQSFFSTWRLFFRVVGLFHCIWWRAFFVLPPYNFLVGAPCDSFYSQIFITFPDRGGLNLLRELFDPLKKLATYLV